jgi:hypothetical protein
MRSRTGAAALTLVLTAALLAGCVPSATPVIPTATPTATPVFASEAEALAAAEAAYKAYLKVSDEILKDGGKNPERLLSVATQKILDEELPGFAEARKRKWHGTGGTTVSKITVESYSPTAPGGFGVIAVYACVDVSEVGFVDSRGKSVVSPERPDVTAFEATFDYQSSNPAGLILAREDLWQGKSFCS